MITIEQIMEQVQVASSVWSIVGTLATHNQEKNKLRAMIERYRKEAIPDG